MGGGEKINSKGPAVPTYCHVPRKTVQAGKGFTLPGLISMKCQLFSSAFKHHFLQPRSPQRAWRPGQMQGRAPGRDWGVTERGTHGQPRPALGPSGTVSAALGGHLASGRGGARMKAQRLERTGMFPNYRTWRGWGTRHEIRGTQEV